MHYGPCCLVFKYWLVELKLPHPSGRCSLNSLFTFPGATVDLRLIPDAEAGKRKRCHRGTFVCVRLGTYGRSRCSNKIPLVWKNIHIFPLRSLRALCADPLLNVDCEVMSKVFFGWTGQVITAVFRDQLSQCALCVCVCSHFSFN